jgi:serine acetyltransferase
MWNRIGDDLRFYQRLRHPRHADCRICGLLLLLTSRGLWQLTMHRMLAALHTRRARGGTGGRAWLLLAYLLTPWELLVKILVRGEILVNTELAPGIFLSNRGYILLGARQVGRGCVIHHNVTIGVDLTTGAMPIIGSDVWIGSESIVFGAITIGDGVTIMPGSVLNKTVPARCVVQGNPARVIRREFDNSVLRTDGDPGASSRLSSHSERVDDSVRSHPL